VDGTSVLGEEGLLGSRLSFTRDLPVRPPFCSTASHMEVTEESVCAFVDRSGAESRVDAVARIIDAVHLRLEHVCQLLSELALRILPPLVLGQLVVVRFLQPLLRVEHVQVVVFRGCPRPLEEGTVDLVARVVQLLH